MPEEVQPLAAATPDHHTEQTAAARAVPRDNAATAADAKAARNPAEISHARPTEPVDPAPAARPAPERPSMPVSAPKPGATAAPRSGGSSNRVRARLARLGVQRSSPYNPVLEPLLRTVRGNDPKIETATLRQIESAYQVAERWHRGQKRKSGDPYITHPSR